MTALWLSGVADIFHSLINTTWKVNRDKKRKLFKPRWCLPIVVPALIFIFLPYSIPFCSIYFSGDWWCIHPAAAAAAAASHDITAAGQEQKQTWCYRGLTEKVNCAKPQSFFVCWLKVQAIISFFSWEGEEMRGWGDEELRTEVSCQRKAH